MLSPRPSQFHQSYQTEGHQFGVLHPISPGFSNPTVQGFTTLQIGVTQPYSPPQFLQYLLQYLSPNSATVLCTQSASGFAIGQC
jgi:hypothetical protein